MDTALGNVSNDLPDHTVSSRQSRIRCRQAFMCCQLLHWRAPMWTVGPSLSNMATFGWMELYRCYQLQLAHGDMVSCAYVTWLISWTLLHPVPSPGYPSHTEVTSPGLIVCYIIFRTVTFQSSMLWHVTSRLVFNSISHQCYVQTLSRKPSPSYKSMQHFMYSRLKY
jgi:hypothetical protein